MNGKLILISLFFIFSTCQSIGQILFSEEHQSLNVFHQTRFSNFSGGISTADFDQDGLDDLTLASGLGDSIKFYKNTGTSFTQVSMNIAGLEHTKQIAWIDYDNDGDLDFFLACVGADNKLYRNDGNLLFTDVTISAGLWLNESPTWTFDWGDYNRDGYLDLYVTNNSFGTGTSFYNYLFKNNGDGTFSDVTAFSGTADGIKNPLATIITDINNDMWPDIFVASDKMHGNALFKNRANGSFEEIAASANANQQICSMSSATGDCDNNGFLDIYITNNPPSNVFLLNNGDETFTNSAVASGVTFNQESWGSMFVDFDNDTDLDLYVSGSLNNSNFECAALYRNEGNAVFTDLVSGIGMEGDTTRSYANAYGDFNNDGFFDIVTNNLTPDSTFIWMNQSAASNWVKFELEGTLSNSFAIGAVMEFYHNGTYQKRYHQVGNGFMAQNSTYEIVGIGQDTLIDSIVVQWPSGMIETYFDISPNQKHTFVEGNLEPYLALVFAEGNLSLCNNSVLLYPNGRYTNVVWNNSINQRTLLANSTGDYFYSAVAPDGSIVYSDTISIVTAPPYTASMVSIDAYCHQEASGYAFSTSPVNEVLSYEWSTGETGFFIDNLSAGEYFLVETSLTGCRDSILFTISEPEPLLLTNTISSASCFGGSDGGILVSAEGGTGTYSYNWSNGASGNEIDQLPSGNYTITVQDQYGCNYTESFYVSQPDPIVGLPTIYSNSCYGDANGSIVLSVSGGNGMFSYQWNTGQTTNQINGLTAGQYSVTITDQSCVSIESYTVSEAPQLHITETVQAETSGQDGAISLQVNGGQVPYSFLWNTGESSSSISGLEGGSYSVTITDQAGCQVEATFIVDSQVGIAYLNETIKISPNPSTGLFDLELPNTLNNAELVVVSSLGQTIQQLNYHSEVEIDLRQYPKGVYFLFVKQNRHHLTLKLIKQ